jgi:hypothetical protein
MFSESASRAIVVPTKAAEPELLRQCQAVGLDATRIGEVCPSEGSGRAVLAFEGLFEVALDDLRQRHEATLPQVLDDPS